MELKSALIIDDNLGDRVLIEKVLKEQNPNMLIDHASNYYTAFDFLKSQAYDLLIVDLNMPGRGGVDFILDMRNENINEPKLKYILTGAAIDQPLREILTDRVDKFVTKDNHMKSLANSLVNLKRH